MTHSKEYDDYINSQEWRDKVERIKRERGYKCERCGGTNQIDGHHKNYYRLRHEKDSDIEIVCRKCHGKADKERAEQSARDTYQRRMEAWARKVYGDEWYKKYTYRSMMECFNFYLEEQGKSEWITM